MKKDNTVKKNLGKLEKSERNQLRRAAAQGRLTIGLDLGDRTSRYCILDAGGEVLGEGALPTTKTGIDSLLKEMPSSRVALEVGTHSPWASRHIAGLGHEVIVANPHKVKLISASVRKNDRIDARQLARLARVDPQLLAPIRHRGAQAQQDLAVIRARAELVETRTALINAARGLVKPLGERLRNCDADQVRTQLAEGLSERTRVMVEPLLKSIEAITEQIGVYDGEIEEIAKRYPVAVLKQVYGVGTLIALTFILTIEDPQRFRRSREVGAYLGLQPKQRDSGDRQPQLGISKSGDQLLRKLLVQAAHCMLRRSAPDSDLRRWGLSKMAEGGKRAKRRAVVGVARKLSVLLHRLWVTAEVYEPLYKQTARSQGVAA